MNKRKFFKTSMLGITAMVGGILGFKSKEIINKKESKFPYFPEIQTIIERCGATADQYNVSVSELIKVISLCLNKLPQDRRSPEYIGNLLKNLIIRLHEKTPINWNTSPFELSFNAKLYIATYLFGDYTIDKEAKMKRAEELGGIFNATAIRLIFENYKM